MGDPWLVRYRLASCKCREAIYSLEAFGLMTNMVEMEMVGGQQDGWGKVSGAVRQTPPKRVFLMQIAWNFGGSFSG